MSAADTLLALEQRAASLNRARTLVAIGVAVIVIAILGTCTDSHRAAYSDGEIYQLEQQTATAQKARHAAAVATIAARADLERARHTADSLGRVAAATEARSAQLGRFVRIASETSLVVQRTPDSASVVSVPRIVTQYVASLVATIADKDRALAARDTQTVRADTVIVTVTREVAADTVVIDSQAKTVTAEKKEQPRFGFKWGLVTGGLIAIVAHFVL